MIHADQLSKEFGRFQAVKNASFQIEKGEIVGFLGPNGAGKTTTLRMLTGYLPPTSGTATIAGFDIVKNPLEARKHLGYLPEHVPLYDDQRVTEYLKFRARLKGISSRQIWPAVSKVVEQCGLDPVRRKMIRTLSKGYRQRVGIAQALLGKPRVIILDEPTVGLDPIQIIEIRDLIRELGRSHTVIFSSHILSEVQTICDEILMIAHGKLVAFDEPGKLEKRLLSPNEINLVTDAGAEQAQKLLSPIEEISSVSTSPMDGGYLRVEIRTDSGDIYSVSRKIFNAFKSSGKVLLEMSLKKANLEDLFIELSEGADDGGSDADSNESEAKEK